MVNSETENECTAELFMIDFNKWSWQIISGLDVVCPNGERFFAYAYHAREDAMRAAKKMNLTLENIVNLEKEQI